MRALRGSSLEWTSRTEEVPLRELIAVPVDVGKSTAMVMAWDFTGRVLLAAVEFPLTSEKSRLDPRFTLDLIFRY